MISSLIIWIIILCQLFLIGMCLLEAFHDRVVIDLQDRSLPNFQQLSKAWHGLSGGYFVGMTLCISLPFLIVCWQISACMFALAFAYRLTFFQNTLNVIRKGWGEFFYLGNDSIDAFWKKTIGGKGLFCFAVALIIGINYLLFFY